VDLDLYNCNESMGSGFDEKCDKDTLKRIDYISQYPLCVYHTNM